MSGQEGYHGSDASAKGQTRSGILTPASDNSLNPSDGADSGAKKRKRDGNTMEDLLKDAFVVRVRPLILVQKPETNRPRPTPPPHCSNRELYNL